MKLALKIWSVNLELIHELNEMHSKDVISHVEIYIVPGTSTNIKYFKALEMPKILHAPHSGSNFNIADENLLKDNLEQYKEVKKFANSLGSETIIVHAGESGNTEDALKCLEKLDDSRIIIENMPKVALNNLECIGFDKESLQPFLDYARGICLDFAHACKAAYSLKRNYKQLIKELMSLNPVAFHLSDGFDNNPKDEHLSIGHGNLDIKYFLKLSDDKPLTLETIRTNHKSLDEDLVNINKIMNLKK